MLPVVVLSFAPHPRGLPAPAAVRLLQAPSVSGLQARASRGRDGRTDGRRLLPARSQAGRPKPV